MQPVHGESRSVLPAGDRQVNEHRPIHRPRIGVHEWHSRETVLRTES